MTSLPENPMPILFDAETGLEIPCEIWSFQLKEKQRDLGGFQTLKF